VGAIRRQRRAEHGETDQLSPGCRPHAAAAMNCWRASEIGRQSAHAVASTMGPARPPRPPPAGDARAASFHRAVQWKTVWTSTGLSDASSLRWCRGLGMRAASKPMTVPTTFSLRAKISFQDQASRQRVMRRSPFAILSALPATSECLISPELLSHPLCTVRPADAAGSNR
jgi:hypothetical protein